MNTSFTTHLRKTSRCHYKTNNVLTQKMFPYTSFLPNVLFKKLTKMLLLCHFFQSWWAKLLVVHIGYVWTEVKELSIYMQYHSHIFWTICQKQNVSQNKIFKVFVSKQYFLDQLAKCTIFWHNAHTCLLLCAPSKGHFLQILKLQGFYLTTTIYTSTCITINF